MAKGFFKQSSAPAETIKQVSPQEAFVGEYQALCNRHGLQIAFEPRWVMSKDQGDYRLVIVPVIAPLPKAAE